MRAVTRFQIHSKRKNERKRERENEKYSEIAVENQMFCFYFVRVNIILFNIYDFHLL